MDYDSYYTKFKAAGWNFQSWLAAAKRSAYQNGYDGFIPDGMLEYFISGNFLFSFILTVRLALYSLNTSQHHLCRQH